jgi:hypothetical protein
MMWFLNSCQSVHVMISLSSKSAQKQFLATIGHAMSNMRTPEEWGDALDKLKSILGSDKRMQVGQSGE